MAGDLTRAELPRADDRHPGADGPPGLQGPLTPYLRRPSSTSHRPPSASTRPGRATLAALDRALEEAGPETVSAFFCEPISGAALPAHKPPDRFWEGLAERRERHGFLICFDEIVTGLGRTGSWFAANDLPFVPDIIATAKGLGAGHTAIGATLCRERVYEGIAAGSRAFPLGHTWNGAPLSCAVGVAVLEALKRERLVERVGERGARLRQELEDALRDVPLVREVRGPRLPARDRVRRPPGRRIFPAPGAGSRGQDRCESRSSTG